MNNFIINYIAPFMIASGATTYALSKINEKSVFKKIDNIKTLKNEPIKRRKPAPKELEGLVSILENNIDQKNLNNLYKNLDSVTVNRNLKLLLLGVKGRYNAKKNTLEYALENAIEHEFMHMSGSCHEPKHDFTQCGFVNRSKGLSFGKALNEGCTDLLTRKVFNKKTRFYNGEVRIAKFIELIIGEEKLKNYYFNNDLVGLVADLSKYMGKENTLKFITDFDLGFDLKMSSNPAYKVVYTNLELKLCSLFKEHNESLLKQIDYLNLLDDTKVTKSVAKIKKINL